MKDSDKMHLITFSENTRDTLKLEAMNEENKLLFAETVLSLQAHGALSNLTAGILAAISACTITTSNYDVVLDKDRTAAMFVFTDGNMNAGIVETDLMLQTIQTALTGNEDLSNMPYVPFSMYFYGMGRDCDSDLLERIATKDKFYSIYKYSHIETIFKPFVTTHTKKCFDCIRYDFSN